MYSIGSASAMDIICGGKIDKTKLGDFPVNALLRNVSVTARKHKKLICRDNAEQAQFVKSPYLAQFGENHKTNFYDTLKSYFYEQRD